MFPFWSSLHKSRTKQLPLCCYPEDCRISGKSTIPERRWMEAGSSGSVSFKQGFGQMTREISTGGRTTVGSSMALNRTIIWASFWGLAVRVLYLNGIRKSYGKTEVLPVTLLSLVATSFTEVVGELWVSASGVACWVVELLSSSSG